MEAHVPGVYHSNTKHEEFVSFEGPQMTHFIVPYLSIEPTAFCSALCVRPHTPFAAWLLPVHALEDNDSRWCCKSNPHGIWQPAWSDT